MRIEVLIDEIVLHGFEPRERHAIGDAIRDELTRLLAIDAGGRALPAAADVERVAVPAVRVAPGGAAGTALAGAVRAAIRAAGASQGRPR